MDKIEQDRFIAWVGQTYNDIQIWGQYERLVDFIFEEYPKSNRRFDEISLPTLFTMSHAVELALKENVKFFKEYHGSTHLTKFSSWANLLKSHDLKALTDEYRIAFMKLHKKVNGKEVEKTEFQKYYPSLVDLIEILDRNSETYRYSLKIDNDGSIIKESINSLKKIDLLEVKSLFDKVKILFIGAPNALGRYTDFIDFREGNPDYKMSKGYLLCQKLPYSESFLENIKMKLNEMFTLIENQRWMDSKSGENYEIKIWNNDIYIIAI